MASRALLRDSRDYYNDAMRETLDALHPRVKIAMALFLLQSTLDEGVTYADFESAKYAKREIRLAKTILARIGNLG